MQKRYTVFVNRATPLIEVNTQKKGLSTFDPARSDLFDVVDWLLSPQVSKVKPPGN